MNPPPATHATHAGAAETMLYPGASSGRGAVPLSMAPNGAFYPSSDHWSAPHSGASSSFDRNLDKGSLVFQTFTRNAEALATTKLMLNEIAKMAKDGPTQDEVTAAVANLAGSYAMRFQTATFRSW